MYKETSSSSSSRYMANFLICMAIRASIKYVVFIYLPLFSKIDLISFNFSTTHLQYYLRIRTEERKKISRYIFHSFFLYFFGGPFIQIAEKEGKSSWKSPILVELFRSSKSFLFTFYGNHVKNQSSETLNSICVSSQ